MAEALAQAPPPAPPNDLALPIRQELYQEFARCELLRPFRRAAYDPGEHLLLSVTGVVPATTGRVVAEVERFVGGGFAGQVYRAWVLDVEPEDGPIAGLTVGQPYAIKILKPPSTLARIFRDFLYFLAYQGAFSAQVNPAAVRTGVLWQKLIRRAAGGRFGTEDAVCDTYATFYDESLHSFGEINEWVSGRIWKFEVDDQLFDRWKLDGPPPPDTRSPEYLHKRLFMRELVGLLHEMGAPELARQYEWWTCKSQPNALKRLGTDHSPQAGLTAIDFRAGLALLPLLPMSPADVSLILHGLARGRIVQFDRSDPRRLRRFLSEHREQFEDLQPVIAELEQQERLHRRSLPDITRHHVRLLTDRSLRRSVRGGAVIGWQHLGWIDAEHAARLHARRGPFLLLWLAWLIPLLGSRIIKLWGHARYREHVGRVLTSWGYLCRALRGAQIETLIVWHRRGRVCDLRARRLVNRPLRYWLEFLLVGWLPGKWHRCLTEPRYAWARLREHVGFVWRMLRRPRFRETWLLEQVELGREEGMLTEAEANKIAGQVKDPYIQKYLKCLAVHLCTVPITQLVMLLVGGAVVAYCLAYRGLSWAQAVGLGTAAAATIQLLPISPGSISRGLFVLYLMIRERDIRSYYIAAPVSFIHVIGYLAFPLQMVAHDPALARFMAGRWARNAVHLVPVFGERGGLLEHAVFDLFFNLPLSVQRRFRTRPLASTLWLLVVLAVAGVIVYDLIVLGLLAYAGCRRLLPW
jgi:hypothetical protein